MLALVTRHCVVRDCQNNSNNNHNNNNNNNNNNQVPILFKVASPKECRQLFGPSGQFLDGCTRRRRRCGLSPTPSGATPPLTNSP